MTDCKNIELLAPAGSPDSLRAAVENGANAVYLGLSAFNARRGATNFDENNLREVVEYCHVRNVRVHVTVNTLVRQDELLSVYRLIENIAKAGADAAIVQDVGVASVFKSIAPNMELHASTQLAVHNRAGVEFLKKNSFDRAVLAREMSIRDIAQCKDAGLPLEAFCHGALCVSCSGQCLLSSLVGGRSGNRGMCAQPCRLPYSLDGDRGYLLSTRDLMLVDRLNDMINVGVTSFKIEGRMRRPEYVSLVTRIYRRALDGFAPSDSDREALLQMFNRGGGTDGYLDGVKDKELTFFDRPNHLGLPVGEVKKDGRILLSRDVEQEDALVLRNRSREEDMPVKANGLAGETVSVKGARAGDRLVRLVSQKQMTAEKETFQNTRQIIPLTGELTVRVGQPAHIFLSDGKNEIHVSGEVVQQALNKPTDPSDLAKRMQKTGGTPYRIDHMDVWADANAFLPVSALNSLRRDALDELTEKRLAAYPAPLSVPVQKIESPLPAWKDTPELVVQSADPEVLLRAHSAGAENLVFAPADVRADALNNALSVLDGLGFAVALPQVLPENALQLLFAWVNRNKDRITRVYISNVSHLSLAWEVPLAGDFPMNIFNAASVRFLAENDISRFTPSVELTAKQAGELGGEQELIVYGRLPLMQLRHCPLRAVRKDPGRHADCRYCDRAKDGISSKVLTDRKGVDFPLGRVVTDEGCIVQLFNSVPIMLLNHTRKLPPAAAWRIILTGDDPVEALVSLYDRARTGEDVRNDPLFTAVSSKPATTGHYFRGVE